MSKKMLVLMCSIFLIVPLLFMGCGDAGDTGPAGAAGATGATGDTGADGKDLTATAKPESCSVCHGGAGAAHQATYDQLYQDNVIRVSELAYAFNATDNTDVVTFKMTKAGAPFDCRESNALSIYFVEYTGTSFENANAARLTLGTRGSSSTPSTLSYNAGTNLCTSTKTQTGNDNLAVLNGLIAVYGYDETLGGIPGTRVQQAKYPFAALLETGSGVDYVSAANVAGCEKCHTVPYLKHGNIYGQVDHVAATDFYTCKVCHQDNGPGGHLIWQLLVDNPALAADVLAQQAADGEDAKDDWEYLTSAQVAQYAYKTRLMNDVHMSHAMEFAYPQSMANCVTCHNGKLTNAVLTDDNFALETCKSCHPVTGSEEYGTSEFALTNIIPHSFTDAMNCALCHGSGGVVAQFSAIHSGYDKKIYTNTGARYSDAIKVTIDNASFADNVLTFGFSATGSLGGLSASNIAPTVSVGLYGYNTKDFIVDPHSGRQLEYALSSTTAHARITKVSAGGGKWVVSANLSTWAGRIADGSVKRVEIGVMPRLENPALPSGDNVVALDAPSRTFDLGADAFDDDFYPAIVKVPTGCNNCHDALGTTFHSADRGGNIVICRLCHTTRSGGSHLEMQSRSIDSYIHAIHSFQAFDIGRALTNGGTDFNDPVEAMRYEHHINSHFPTFGINNCESCHVAGKYNVPDQSKSLPGILSASWPTLVGWDRNIGVVPSYVTGPASRACGACHRVEWINEDDPVSLASFNSHTATNGYLLKNTDSTVLDNAINTIFSAEYFGSMATP